MTDFFLMAHAWARAWRGAWVSPLREPSNRMQLLTRLRETRQPHLQSFNACASHSEAATGTMDEALVLAEDAVLASGELLVEVSPLEMLWRWPSQSQYPLVSPLQIPWRLLLLLRSQLQSVLALASHRRLGRKFPSMPAVLGRQHHSRLSAKSWSCRRCRSRSSAVRS